MTMYNDDDDDVQCLLLSLHCAQSLAAQCIVIGHVCGFICCGCVCSFVCLWVCYHDNSKLRVSIFTKLGL